MEEIEKQLKQQAEILGGLNLQLNKVKIMIYTVYGGKSAGQSRNCETLIKNRQKGKRYSSDRKN